MGSYDFQIFNKVNGNNTFDKHHRNLKWDMDVEIEEIELL